MKIGGPLVTPALRDVHTIFVLPHLLILYKSLFITNGSIVMVA